MEKLNTKTQIKECIYDKVDNVKRVELLRLVKIILNKLFLFRLLIYLTESLLKKINSCNQKFKGVR